MLPSDVVSIQPTALPLLGVSGSKEATINPHYLGESHKDGVQKPSYFHGWRMGVALCAATAGSVLMTNIMLTVFASIKYGIHDGFGALQKGSCRVTKDPSLWLHFAINILSTLLLGASNHLMQCLTSPTREKVDTAYGQHVWLDIGVPSVRNLRRIATYRIFLWCLLAASIIPLHLLWNSAVFSTLSSQQYTVFAASPDLFNVAGLNWSAPIPTGSNVDGITYENSYTLENIRNASSWEKLDNTACIKAYSQEFV